MDVLWNVAGPVKVRDVQDELNKSRNLAYTTVLTVLDNLHRKGWVSRERDGRAFRYLPAESRAAAAARTLRDLLSSTGDPEAVLLHFAQSATERESAALRQGLRRRDEL